MSKLLAFALVLFAYGVLVPPASAAPAHSADTLAVLLPSREEVESATGLSFLDPLELLRRDNPVTVGRVFSDGRGTFVSVHLFASPDGAAPSQQLRRSLQDGTFLREQMTATFPAIDRYEALRAISPDGDDFGASFYSLVRGETFSLVADSFWRGSIYGLIIHNQRSANDVNVTRATLSLMFSKLPR